MIEMDKDVANAVLTMAYDYAFRWALFTFVAAALLGWVQSLALLFLHKSNRADIEDINDYISKLTEDIEELKNE